jgi:hypothetical protein
MSPAMAQDSVLSRRCSTAHAGEDAVRRARSGGGRARGLRALPVLVLFAACRSSTAPDPAASSWPEPLEARTLRVSEDRLPERGVERLVTASQARSGPWEERAALRAYESLLDEGAWDPLRARAVIEEFPGTYGATMLRARLDRITLESAAGTMDLDGVVAFLEGQDVTVPGEVGAIELDQQRFRDRYERPFREALEARILAAGCADMMGYCTWWVSRFPDAASTGQIVRSIDEVWRHRANPGWKGGRHHRCAYRCGTTCRQAASPLDDSCYAPCYAKCS